MAKVASTSIYHSIKSQCDVTPYHIHSLDDHKIKESEALALSHHIIPDSRQVGGLIYQHQLKQNKPIKIITCVRDPLERNLSAFFEAFQYHTGVRPEDWKGSQEELLQVYHTKLDHDYPILWFEDELERMTGINVYDLAFDHSLMWSSQKIGNIDLLILRTDLADKIKSQVLREFLGCESFELKRYNVGSNKPYSLLYRHFLESAVFPQAYLSRLYDTQYANFFYSKEEIKASIGKRLIK